MHGRVALVTGASRGIGRAIALGYAEAGADVAVLARGRAEVNSIAEEIRERGVLALALVGDVADEFVAAASVERTVAELGRIDVLVNNAGVGQSIAGKPIRTLLDVDPTVWDTMFATNCRGPFLMMRAVIPHMLARERGVVINIHSGLAFRATPGSAPYGPTKAALVQLTRVVSAEFSDAGLRVHLLHPGGPVETMLVTSLNPPTSGKPLLSPDVMVPAAVWLATSGDLVPSGLELDCREWNAERGIA